MGRGCLWAVDAGLSTTTVHRLVTNDCADLATLKLLSAEDVRSFCLSVGQQARLLHAVSALQGIKPPSGPMALPQCNTLLTMDKPGSASSPLDCLLVRRGFGRIRFGHSELTGYMSHTRALEDGARAAKEAIESI